MMGWGKEWMDIRGFHIDRTNEMHYVEQWCSMNVNKRAEVSRKQLGQFWGIKSYVVQKIKNNLFWIIDLETT